MALTSGTRFGPYVVSEPLGAGGMGEVYRATDTNLGRDVALKVLPDLVSHDPERMARFEREARTLAALSHPNIATVHGLEKSADAQALIMEMVEGPTLADRIAAGPLPADDVLPIARQIAEALEAAHASGIVHRDLKPANVKVRPDGTVKVLDFGLAKAVEPSAAASGIASLSPTITSPAQTLQGVILGTAAYMSPEQARGRAVDQRTDIWAFGCVLYEMVTGRRAFEGDDVSMTLARVLERDADLQALPPGVSLRVRQVVTVCLRKDLRQRAQSIGDVRLMLDGAFENTAPQTQSTPAARPSWWQRGSIFAAGAVLAGAAAGLVAFRPGPLPPVVRFQIHAPAGSRLPQGTPAISNDGRMLAYTVADAEGVARIHVRAIDHVDSRVLPGTEGAVHPFWSPDGRALAFATLSDNQLKRVDVEAGVPRILGTVTAPWHGTWKPGAILLMSGQQVPVQVPDEGGPGVPVAQVDAKQGERQINYPAFLPDGQRFLARVITGKTSSIQLATLGSTARTLVLDNVTSAPIPAPTPGGRIYLLFMRATELLAQEFDERSGAVRGAPKVLVSDIGQVANPPIRPAVGVSPAGILAYQTGGVGTTGQLGWVDQSGIEVGVLSLDASVAGPRLSPDGSLLAGHKFADGETDVWITDLKRGTSTRLTFSGNSRDAVWSPDGMRLAFRKAIGDAGIFVIGVDGSDERRLTDLPGTVSSWSPDSQYLLHESKGRLTMLPVQGKEKPVDVGSRNGRARQGMFSPDGKCIAYVSDESGRNEVYVQAVLPGKQRVRVSVDGGVDPRWRRQGKELYFVTTTGAMMKVNVETGDRFSADVPRQLFRTVGRNIGYSYDARADGLQFLVPRLDLQDAPITVVLNWWAELE